MIGHFDRICLIVPYYEAGEDLITTLASVRLRGDDLIIVVDDGSSICPARTLTPPTIGPTPVDIVELERNEGIAAALREGATRVPQDYGLLARLDCGDTCAPERFERQREYMARHPSVVLLGSWVDFVSPEGDFLYQLEQPVAPESVRRRMHVNCAITHPAAIFRREVYTTVGGYPMNYPAAEDFALFMRLLERGDGANIPESLVCCRTDDGGISERRRREQLVSRCRLLVRYFDGRPASLYGLLRVVAQMATPRSWSTYAHRIRQTVGRWLPRTRIRSCCRDQTDPS